MKRVIRAKNMRILIVEYFKGVINIKNTGDEVLKVEDSPELDATVETTNFREVVEVLRCSKKSRAQGLDIQD